MNFVIPLCKIDEERRLIIGKAAQETPDRSKEILDYETAKPAFQKWSDSFHEATGGLSKGNLRVMHTKTVAGKIVDLSFDDDTKSINVVAKVVDDNEWQKCLQGVYTGFSVGGGYGKTWQDGDLRRYTPVVNELSLVDRPCIPTAQFAELLKADGMVEQLALHGVTPSVAEIWAARPRSFGNVLKEDLAKAEAARPRSFEELLKFGTWDESKHSRGSKGSANGGQFVSEGGGDAAPAASGGGWGRAAAAVGGGLAALAALRHGGGRVAQMLATRGKGAASAAAHVGSNSTRMDYAAWKQTAKPVAGQRNRFQSAPGTNPAKTSGERALPKEKLKPQERFMRIRQAAEEAKMARINAARDARLNAAKEARSKFERTAKPAGIQRNRYASFPGTNSTYRPPT